jgi:hypothetical protein
MVLWISGIHTKAQENDKSSKDISMNGTTELIQGDFIDFEMPVVNDVVQLRQVGNLNQLTAIQQLENPSVYILTAQQNGNNNTGLLTQSGDNHESLLLQKGNLNSANLSSKGSLTQNWVYQDGNGNQVESLIENYTLNQKSTTSIQEGNNNEVMLNFISVYENPTPNGLFINQDGNNNMADITIDNYNIPDIKIEQMGGAKVIIQNSDFNYPLK